VEGKRSNAFIAFPAPFTYITVAARNVDFLVGFVYFTITTLINVSSGIHIVQQFFFRQN